MQNRIYTFITGVESSVAPDPGTPSASADVVPFSYLIANFSPRKRITGTLASPYTQVLASTAVVHGLISSEDECFMFMQGPGAGTQDLSNATQIAVGTRVGQRLGMYFTSATARVKFEDGNGLSMKEGDAIVTALGTYLEWHWDGTSLWHLTNWNNVGDLG